MCFIGVRKTTAAGWPLVLGLFVALGQGLDRPTTAAPPSAVTDEEVRAFADALKKGGARGDRAVFNSLVDWDALLDKAMDKIASDTFREVFRKAAKSSLDMRTDIASMIFAQTKQGGSFKLLRSRLIDKQKTALYRLALPKGAGVNYLEFMLDRRPDGNVRAVDLYVLSMGEPISQTLHRGYVQAAVQQTPELLAQLAGTEQDYIKSWPKITEMRELAGADHNRDAVSVYNQLPTSVQKDKSILLLRLEIAQKLDEKDYSTAVEQIRGLFPHDPSVDLGLIGSSVLLKQYDKALGAIDRLDKALGGDPYLNTLRAGALMLAGRPQKAQGAARAGVEGAPDVLSCYVVLLSVDVKLDDHVGALETLELIDQRFKVKIDLTTSLDSTTFIKSPQYQEWKAYLTKKAAGAKPGNQ